MVSVDAKQHRTQTLSIRVQDLCESCGGRPGLPVPNSPYGLCGRKAILNLNSKRQEFRICVKVEVAVVGSQSLRSLWT